METIIMLGVAGVLLFSVIAMGAAVFYTIQNRRKTRQIHGEYDVVMKQFDDEMHQRETSIEPTADPLDQDLFFLNDEKMGKTVRFYASAPSMGIDMSMDQAIECDYDEVCAYVDRIFDNTEDNFFVLEDDKDNCIQFLHDGINDTLDMDIPVPDQNGSYQGEFSTLSDAKTCIRSFFRGVNITFEYPVTFEPW